MVKRKRRLLKSTVGIICPTYNPDLFFDRLLPSVKHITELSATAGFLINFNGPHWSNDLCFKAVWGLQDYGFNVLFRYTGLWDKPIQVLKMREQCASLWPEADLYLFIDDDFKFMPRSPRYPFSSGQRYLHSIDYMTRFPRCGVLNTKSFLGGTPQKLKIVPVKSDLVATGQGLFLRNMRENGFILYPKDTHELRGGLEETLAAMLRVECGFFISKQMNNPTVHVTGKLSDYDSKADDFHNIRVIDNNIGNYLKDRYDDWAWLFEQRRYPQKLWELYKENGGIEISDDLVINYAEYEEFDESTIGKPRRK